MLGVKLNNKGVSLILVIGLIVFLMVGATTIFLLISRSFNGIRRIEWSNRAYFAAESGMENALYELSAHSAGYETPTLDSNEVRRDVFSSTPRSDSQWNIESMDADGNFGGTLDEGETLTLSFYQDDSGTVNLDDNEINVNPGSVDQIDTSDSFSVTLQIPFDNGDNTDYSLFFNTASSDPLLIDNDNDGSLNEDGEADVNDCGGPVSTDDGDCDGREDEDSPEDVIVFWQLYDDEGRILSPLLGCLEDGGSEICEKDFEYNPGSGKIEVTLDQGVRGQRETGSLETIGEFLFPAHDGRSANSRIEMDLLVSSRLVQWRSSGSEKGIPHLEYQVQGNGSPLPLPYFTLQSDGWFQNFKQSITTQLIPQGDVSILNITIIQN